MMKKKWCEAEIRFLEENYSTMNFNEMKLRLSRSRDSIAKKCGELGLNRLYRKPPNADVSTLLSGSIQSYYWIGFLLADGSFGKNNVIHLTLAYEDRDHVAKYAEFIKLGNPIKTVVTKTNKAERFHGVYVGTGNSVVVPEIKNRFDIDSNKTHNPPNMAAYTLTLAEWMSLIIGFLDGDGSINYTPGGQVRAIVKCHHSWLLNLTVMQDKVREFSGSYTRGRARINPYGAAQVIFGDDICKSLLDFARRNNLTLLERKWAKVIPCRLKVL